MFSVLKRLRARLEPVFQSDTAFVESAFREILGRPVDQDGLNHYTSLLRQGLGRTAVLLSLMRSEEFTSKLAPKASAIRSLRADRPGQYRDAVDRTNGQTIVVFDARQEADFDWLERGILDNGYYELPGVWNFGIDTDKRVVAEMIASFGPKRTLELGCAAGAVMECLRDRDIAAEGIEISSMAIARAPEQVRSQIHQGDLLTLTLPQCYDTVFGLDVFEHLNPNRLASYIARLYAVTCPGGFFFCNVPAFGADPVFGTVFPLYVDGWQQEADAGRPFSALHVDENGYPVHGHLTWADARWWVRQFEAPGFRREMSIEQALHAKYDGYMTKRSPARRAFFVFGKEMADAQRAAVIDRITRRPSDVLQ
jgi:hypothetical protein